MSPVLNWWRKKMWDVWHTRGDFSFPLTKFNVILHMSSLQSPCFFQTVYYSKEETKTSLYKCLLLQPKLAVALYWGETLITPEVTMFSRTCSRVEVGGVKGQSSTGLKNLLLLQLHQLSWSQGNYESVQDAVSLLYKNNLGSNFSSLEWFSAMVAKNWRRR